MGWSQTLTSDEACAGLRDFFFTACVIASRKAAYLQFGRGGVKETQASRDCQRCLARWMPRVWGTLDGGQDARVLFGGGC